jgi:hypothetical protein
VALVGAPGGVAALMASPRAGSTSAEVLDFVNSLVAHNQVHFDGPAAAKTRSAAIPAVRAPSETSFSRTTHAVRKRGRKRELQRIRFACGAWCTGG